MVLPYVQIWVLRIVQGTILVLLQLPILNVLLLQDSLHLLNYPYQLIDQLGVISSNNKRAGALPFVQNEITREQ